jgi:hypothetical protein
MKKHEEEQSDQLWFEEQLTGALTAWDAAHAPQTPDFRQLEALVEGHKQAMRTKLWLELLLLWITAGCILLLMLWMLDRSMVWFAILQVVIALGGAGFVGMAYSRRRAGIWKS